MYIDVTVETFENEVLKCDTTVLVDFWATWCGPCKMFAPIIEEFAEEHKGEVKVCKVNIDEQISLAERYGVMSIPTVLVFKDGNVVKTSVGVVDKAELCAISGIE